ncbi:MAG: amidohydrolase family protein [bacterium]
MEPYYQVAEENSIPVCLHTGFGPPGGPHAFAPKFRTTLGEPTLFEPVLVRHTKLKAFIAHSGWPYISETIAMLYIYPDLYTNIGVLIWALSKEAFYSALKQLMDARFGKRIMFGTDQMLWPEAISIAVSTVQEAPFLSDEEKKGHFL